MISWTQIGQDIDGDAAMDNSGHSVSLSGDGTTMAVGAIYNDGVDGSKINSGHVRVYRRDANNANGWVQVGGDIDGEAAGDGSGFSVSLSADGTIVAIGADWNHGVNGAYSGHVRVYKFVAETETTAERWDQLGEDIDGEAGDDFSGYSVSLSDDGKIVTIGAYNNNGVNGAYSGHVRVYRFEDKGAPVITLNGTNPTDLELGAEYVDLVTASDNFDGNLTDSIEITGIVDVWNAGIYTLTYNVTDAAGNAATAVIRTVNVFPISTRIDIPYTYTPIFNGFDDDSILTYSATLPEWLFLDSSTGILSGTPLNDHVGINSVSLTATDSNDVNETLTFNITVTINSLVGVDYSLRSELMELYETNTVLQSDVGTLTTANTDLQSDFLKLSNDISDLKSSNSSLSSNITKIIQSMKK